LGIRDDCGRSWFSCAACRIWILEGQRQTEARRRQACLPGQPALYSSLTEATARLNARPQRVSPVTEIGISPYAVEYGPNPVIHRHLATLPEDDVVSDQQLVASEDPYDSELQALRLDHATRSKLLEGLDELEQHARSHHTGESLMVPGRNLDSRNSRRTQVAHFFKHAASVMEGATASTNSVDHSPSIATLAEPDAESDETISFGTQHGIERRLSAAYDRDLNSDEDLYMTPAHWEHSDPGSSVSPHFRDEVMALDTAHEVQQQPDAHAVGSDTDSTEPSPATWDSSPASASTAPSLQTEFQYLAEAPQSKKNIPAPPMFPDTAVFAAMIEFPCPASGCDLVFATPGKRTTHINRKHNRRFACGMNVNGTTCSYATGLRADLERHKITVHRTKFKPQRVFKCPNSGCNMADKVWTRKDNFSRHVERCGRTTSIAQP
jgi:hypothetical protein